MRRKIAGVIVCMGLLSLLVGCSGLRPKGSNGIGKSAKDNESGLSSFYYSKSGMGVGFSYEIKDEDGKKVFIFESIEHREYGVMKLECPDTVTEQLNQMYLDLRLAEWDGFDKNNPNVKDGSGFTLRISFNDGAKMSAEGENVRPERFSDFEKRMKEILDPICDELIGMKRQEIIDNGINGHLTSVMFTFKQQGTSGKDEYHLLLRSENIVEKNLEVKIKSVSEDYFKAGENTYYLTAPLTETNLAEFEQAIKDNDILEWYDLNEHTDDPNNTEWFQISFNYDDGLSISAYGTKHPDHYDEFRDYAIRWMKKLLDKFLTD